MCVKEFYGFPCGHCSIPVLRQCPLTLSNPIFPPCQFPAERPIYLYVWCPPCGRIAWNDDVLRDEEEHRGRHKRDECFCDVIFDDEDRERHLRARPSKGKGKAKDSANSDVPTAAFTNAGPSDGPPTGPSNTRQSNAGPPPNVISPAYGMTQNTQGPYFAEPAGNNPRAGWNPAAQAAAHEYVGYPGATNFNANIPSSAQGQGYPVGGYGPSDSMWPAQPMIGQPGAGMKWYPQSQVVNLPTSFPIPSGPMPYMPQMAPVAPVQTPFPRQFDNYGPTSWQRPASEPNTKSEFPTPEFATPESTSAEPDTKEVVELAEGLVRGPMVVSSDMAYDSTMAVDSGMGR